jgi:hypothetical protein
MERKQEPSLGSDASDVQGPRRRRGVRGNLSTKIREPTEGIAVVLKVKDIQRIDALGGRFSAPWHTATRSDIIRGLLLAALDEAETELPSPVPRGRARPPA